MLLIAPTPEVRRPLTSMVTVEMMSFEHRTLDTGLERSEGFAVGDLNDDGRPDVLIGPAEAFRDGKDHVLAWYRKTGQFGQDWPRVVIRS